MSAMDSSVYTKVDARCIPKSFELHREDADHQPSMPFMSNAIHARVHLLLLRPRKIGAPKTTISSSPSASTSHHHPSFFFSQ